MEHSKFEQVWGNIYKLFKNISLQRVCALFFAFVIIFNTFIPIFKAYAESLPASDGSGALLKHEQPLPLANKNDIKTGTNAMKTSVSGQSDLLIDKKQQTSQSVLGQNTINTTLEKDPVKTYQDEQSRKIKESSQILTDKEVVSKRTVNSRTYLNNQGGETERIFSEPINYKKDNKWQTIDGVLKNDEIYNKAEANKGFLFLKLSPGDGFTKKSVRQDDGFLNLKFDTLGEKGASIKVATDQSQPLSITPINTSKKVNPSIQNADDGTSFVQYLNAWPNTDLYYEQHGQALKEYIKLNNNKAPTEFEFKVDGAKLSLNKGLGGKLDGTITATLPDRTTFLIPALSLSSIKSGPISNPKLGYKLKDNIITVSLDKAWLKTQPANVFPLVIDPSYSYTYNTSYHTGIPGGDVGQFVAYKSDGYICNSNNCDMNVGTLNDNGAKTWRTLFHLPVNNSYGKNVIWANIYSRIVTRPYAWPGFAGSRTYNATWASCMGFNCISGAPRATGNIDGDGNLNATALMQWFSGNNVGDAWLALWAANEGDINSFKALSGGSTSLDVVYRWTVDHPNQPTPLPTLSSPAKDATVVVNRPTLKVNPVSDPDGDKVRYAFHVFDSKGNVIAYSPELDTPSWTMPANTLVDGEQYSWNAWVLERDSTDTSRVENGWRPTDETRSFKYCLRTNKDKTQTYDTVGPVNVSLNTGNVYTHNSSHSISALGGDIGIGLDYNSTLSLAHYGVSARYYSGDNYGTTVEDPNIDMNWGSGSPYPGTIPADNFNVDWGAYFIAPQDGKYTFGSNTDGDISMGLGNYDNNSYTSTDVFNHTGGGKKWAATTVNLKKGSAYGLDIRYHHISGSAYATLNVRTPDGVEQVITSNWLKTTYGYGQNVGNQGLSAKFYKNVNPTTNTSFIINDKTPLVFTANVPRVSTNWGTGSLVPTDPSNQYSDDMIVNYSGYVTIPIAGDYSFGGTSDDGLRIRLGGKQVFSQTLGTGYSTPVHFDTGQIVPIQVDYYEAKGGANVDLRWRGPAGNDIIPGQYLTRTPKIIPGNWKLNINPSGSVSYQSLSTKINGDIELTDPRGSVHLYTWNGGGYKPPINEDGYLIKNSDNTYTFTDIDGTVYTYNVDGMINSVTSPADDKKSSALQYIYQNTSLSAYAAMPKLSKIVDSVDPSRYGRLYYWGELGSDAVCSIQAGFDKPPVGYLCAFKTFPDGQVTKFDYKSDIWSEATNLSRIEKPGNELTDYSYDSTFDPNGQLFAIRDSIANDAIMSGTRVNDSSTQTHINYDGLLRATSIIKPKPFGTVVPNGQTNPSDYQVSNWYEYGIGITNKHIFGDSEPKGYSQSIKYDDLYRTIEACDNLALCNKTVWDPAKDLPLSTTNSSGMMSTTIYNEDDQPIEQYGDAPVAWFGADRRPLAAYSSQIPKSVSGYDEGIKGPAVAWYGARGDSLFGSPKLHTNGIDATDKLHTGRNFASSGAVPINTDATTPGYGFSATGKIKFPGAGLYTFQIKHDDGVRLYVDDKLILDNKWTTRTAGATQNTDEATFNAAAGKLYRFRLDYIHFDDGTGPGSVNSWLRGPGITDISGSGIGTDKFGSLISPAYGLTTSSTVTDSALGSTTVNTTYKDSAYGLVDSATLDSAGLNYKASVTYEAQGTGYLRQTSKTLPGNTKTSYSYYTGTAQVDNPCTVGVDNASQAGKIQFRTDTDPDGAGTQTARKTENVYDNVGRPVATRVNSDPWTCTFYDSRSRPIKVIVPDAKNATGVAVRLGSVTTNNYAVGGNSLISSATDTAIGTTTSEVDLLGRVIRSVDSFGSVTTLIYDRLGRPTTKISSVGTEVMGYDDYNRPTTYSLGGKIYASVVYDSFSRTQSVQYPQSKNAAGTTLKLEQAKHDSRQRSSGVTFRFSDGTAFDETLALSSTGLVLSSTDNLKGLQAASNYSYDKAGRLTQAVVDKMKYTYDFSAPSANICNQSGVNLNSNKNSNRTKYTATNITTSATTASTTQCYNQADQLVYSTDLQIGTPTYDDHGNTVSLAGAGTPIKFTYNSLDQNTAISQGANKVVYVKATDGTILRKKEYSNNILAKSYRYLAGSRVLQACSLTNDNICTTVDTYLTLPGGVTATLSPTNPDTAKRAVYSVKNFHGDTALTVGSTGLVTSSVYLYEPFGQASPSQTFGTNSSPTNSTDQSMGWAADPKRKSEKLFSVNIVQMGARVYLPSQGRFLQVDSVEGGTPNSYVYVGDPINDNDYSGLFGWGDAWNAFKSVIKVVVVAAIAIVTAVVAVAVFVAVSGVVASIAAASAVVAVGSMIAHAYNSYGTKDLNAGSVAQAGAGGAAIGLFVFGGATVVAAMAGPVSNEVQAGASLPNIPANWISRTADNGKGIVYQLPNSVGNANMIRVMEPTEKYVNGYVRIYNSYGQPVDAMGKVGPQSLTHIPLDYPGPWGGWPQL